MYPGLLLKITCINFMKYEKLIYIPSSKLNFILGLNGLGKSTIFCAIVLGLGGKTIILKRNDKPGLFIKAGCTTATIILELVGPDNEIIEVKRTLNRNGSTKWYIDNVECKIEKIEELCKKINIQLDNLCQVLPQERVSDFAKMKPIELLENTQNTVGDPKLSEYHTFLKDKTKTVYSNEENLKNLENSLKEEKEKGNSIYEKVKSHLEKLSHINKIRLIEKYKIVINFKEIKIELTQIESEQKTITNKINGFNNEKRTVEKLYQKLVTSLGQHNLKMEDYHKQISNIKKDIFSKNKAMQNNSTKIREVFEKIEENEKMQKSRIEIINKNRKKLEEKKKNYQNLQEKEEEFQLKLSKLEKSIVPLTAKINSLNDEQQTIENNIAVLEQEKSTLQLLLNKMKNIDDEKIDILKKRNSDVYRALNWLKSNMHLFSKHVYGPVFTEINLDDQSNAKYIENVISQDDMFAFICQDKDDAEIILSRIREEQGLLINCARAPQNPVSFYKPNVPIFRIGQIGFSSYLLELFKAPDPLMAYICQHYNVHNIPIGSEVAKDFVNDMCDLKFRKFFIENEAYTNKVSRYGTGARSISTFRVREPSLIKRTVSKEEMSMQESKVAEVVQNIEEAKNVKARLESKVVNLEKELHQINGMKQEGREQLKTLRLSIATIDRDIKYIQSLEKAANAEEVKKEAQSQLDALFQAHLGLGSDLSGKVKQELGSHGKLAALSHFVTLMRKKKGTLEERLRAIDDQYTEVKQQDNQLRKKKEIKLKEAESLVNVAKNLQMDLNNISANLKKGFSKLPTSLEELDQLRSEEQIRAALFAETDERSIQEYERHKARLAQLENEYGTLSDSHASLLAEIADIKGKWLPELEDLISKIDHNFRRYMNMLNCSGEVALDKGENPEHFDKYGISLRVKFRANQPLKELTSTHQSGGERSVATIIYMLALQGLTKVPFRCLDEINQGMDSTNERRVIDLLGKICDSARHSQYFLVSPKLLHNLTFPHTTKVVLLNYQGADAFININDEIDYLHTSSI